MQNLRRISTYLCIGIVIIFVILAAMYREAQIEKDLPQVVLGKPGIFTESSFDVNRISIGQLLHDQNRLYLLDDQDGYIRVFDLNGNYLYTIMLYDYMNGAFRMAVMEGKLYIADPHNDVYIFADDTFVEFQKRQDAEILLKSVDFGKNSDAFEIRAGSIYNVANDTCVIKRSVYTALNRRTRLLILALVVLVIYLCRRKRK